MRYLRVVPVFFVVLIFLSSCSTPQDKAIKELKEKGIKPTAVSLVNQVKEGNTENVQLLLAAGVSAKSVGEKGYSALAWAAAKGHADIVKMLIDGGADKDLPDKDGDTPLISAVKTGKIDAAVVLVQAGARTDATSKSMRDRTALEIAMIDKKNWPMVTALGKAGMNLDIQDEDGRTWLNRFVTNWSANRKKVEALLDGGADVNLADKQGITPLIHAINQDEPKFVALLAARGADVNARRFGEFSALQKAVIHKQYELATTLVSAGADINFGAPSNQETALHMAVKNNQTNFVELLIAGGANLNTKNSLHQSPLTIALIDQKNFEIAELLVEAGADINVVGNEQYGNTLLHTVSGGQGTEGIDILKYLLSKGAKTNVHNSNGDTPLTIALTYHNVEKAKVLIEAGADVNLANSKNGYKPLYYTRKGTKEDIQIAEMLKKAGAKE